MRHFTVFEIRDDKNYAIALYLKGLILYDQREYDWALEYYNMALEILPDDEAIKKSKDELLDNFAVVSRDNW